VININGLKIVALDSDADRLKRVQENIERFNIKNITLFQGKAQTQDYHSPVYKV
jgi:16S rRNA (cytosine967-C5)-methyltransferase